MMSPAQILKWRTCTTTGIIHFRTSELLRGYAHAVHEYAHVFEMVHASSGQLLAQCPLCRDAVTYQWVRDCAHFVEITKAVQAKQADKLDHHWNLDREEFNEAQQKRQRHCG